MIVRAAVSKSAPGGRSWLDAESEFDVLEIFVGAAGRVSCRLLRPDGTPVLVEMEQLDVVDPVISAHWSVHVLTDGSLVIGPGPWHRAGFWEDFFDGDAVAVAEFEEWSKPSARVTDE